MVSALSQDIPDNGPAGREVLAREVLAEVRLTDAPVVAPRLAIVINCYNYEKYIAQAIQSVVSQQRDDCELVVVDDGSTDSSWDIISRSGVTAYRIRNSGQVGACLFGADRTRAPFVLFLDADDTLKPGSIAAILDHLDPDVAKLQFSLTRIDADGKVTGAALPALEAFRAREDLVAQVLRSGTYISPPTSGNVFRRDLCDILREAEYEDGVDGAILFAAPFMGDVVSLPDELGCYRVHGGGKSGLGSLPDADRLERHATRFVDRMEHLRVILDRMGLGDKLPRPQQMFFFLERHFCASIARGERPPLTGLPELLTALYKQTAMPLKNKCVMSGFYIIASLLPSSRSQALLAYRLNAGERSMGGLLSAVIRK
ncbi:MAG: glycosyltransferase family 2 protein [Pseudochelatococcus sp.]|jgi:hypothetical protein|uniref:glycosyltransferase family 2 protein n=1 Tax=Pseudochelatococcus sp. TaxID=2020869 RepID=UPI003D8CB52E